ncbi:hypothetical protein [Streptomyces sp. NPDC057363]|uniref:hypothetical protein n=1 Tax=Streptomyces sp. NPDC057363 TaxID=3346107 RepID=UPI003641C31D
MSITDEFSSFVVDVRAWGNMIDVVQAFTECVTHYGKRLTVKADLYATGYAMVNGFNVRVSPIGEGDSGA